MVQPTHPRNRDDLPIFAQFDSPFSRCVLFKPEMGSVRVAMVNIIDLVIVANKEAPRQIERAGFDYLLGGPLRSRILGRGPR